MPRKVRRDSLKAKQNIYNQLIEHHLDHVREMAAGGMTVRQIGLYYGITPTWMGKLIERYPELQDAFDQGLAQGIARATKSLMQQIDNGNVISTIFFLKVVAKWVEHEKVMNRYDPETAPRVQILLPDNSRNYDGKVMISDGNGEVTEQKSLFVSTVPPPEC